MLASEYHMHIWLQWHLSNKCECDAKNLTERLKESNRYYGRIENFAYREINEPSFSNPYIWGGVLFLSWCNSSQIKPNLMPEEQTSVKF